MPGSHRQCSSSISVTQIPTQITKLVWTATVPNTLSPVIHHWTVQFPTNRQPKFKTSAASWAECNEVNFKDISILELIFSVKGTEASRSPPHFLSGQHGRPNYVRLGGRGAIESWGSAYLRTNNNTNNSSNSKGPKTRGYSQWQIVGPCKQDAQQMAYMVTCQSADRDRMTDGDEAAEGTFVS